MINQKKHLEGKELLRLADVLIMLGVGKSTLDRYVKAGLPKYQPPKCNAYYMKSEIIAWIKKHQVKY